jgi:hypothetical protein
MPLFVIELILKLKKSDDFVTQNHMSGDEVKRRVENSAG